MRLDKFLKVSRLVKRRTVANELCDAKHIDVNGKTVKASYEVKVGDVIEIRVGSNVTKARVVGISEYATKENASEMYEIIN